jgi:hypothetical protein
MASPLPARLCLVGGAVALLLTIGNQITATQVYPALQRSSVLASLLAVSLLLIGSLWVRIVPRNPERADLKGEQGLELATGLHEPLRQELAWGSQMLLTATPAAVVCLHWRGRTLLRRGLIGAGGFDPGPICARACEQGRAISLVDLRLYPGRQEFEGLLPGLPAVVVQPLGADGVLVLGGWAPRCFDRSDLLWLEGWARKITAGLVACASADPAPPAAREPAPST